jgi:hypothetical protein
MPRSVRPVTVTTQLQQLDYPWATSVTVSRRGDLKIWQGLKARAFHPAGEWTMYTVAALPPGSEEDGRGTRDHLQ